MPMKLPTPFPCSKRGPTPASPQPRWTTTAPAPPCAVDRQFSNKDGGSFFSPMLTGKHRKKTVRSGDSELAAEAGIRIIPYLPLRGGAV